MKKIRKKTKLSLILFVAMAFMLFGCGNAKDETASNETVSAETETEVVEEAEPSLEPAAEGTPEAQDVAEPEVSDEQFEDPTPTVDWETFAAQEDSDDICVAISNETTGFQYVVSQAGLFAYTEGDRIAIPIRESIEKITYYWENEDGSKQGDTEELYRKDESSTSPKYIEFTVGDEARYYLSIFTNSNDTIDYCITNIKGPSSELVDWETFAAQENSGDICMAISNETTGIQNVLYEGGTQFHTYHEGDRIAIPIRDSIEKITYQEDNGNELGEEKELYIKNEGNNTPKYIEIEIGEEDFYFVNIFKDTEFPVSFIVCTIPEDEQ